MTTIRTHSVSVTGVDGHVVDITAALGSGTPGLHVAGIPDAALHEFRDRVRAAVVNSGLPWPAEHITLTVSPALPTAEGLGASSAPLRRFGSRFDLAAACAILTANGAIGQDGLARTVLLSELALDGRLRPTSGVLAALLAARTAGMQRAVVPAAVLYEAALITGIHVHGARRLTEVVEFLRGQRDLQPLRLAPPVANEATPPDLADLANLPGLQKARRVLEIAAAGGHHVLLVGAPGTGKTLLARRLPALLPNLTHDQALEIAAIRSAAGQPASQLNVAPPFVAPHHSISMAGLLGAGSAVARPGAVTLAHGGGLPLGSKAHLTSRGGVGACERST